MCVGARAVAAMGDGGEWGKGRRPRRRESTGQRRIENGRVVAEGWAGDASRGMGSRPGMERTDRASERVSERESESERERE